MRLSQRGFSSREGQHSKARRRQELLWSRVGIKHGKISHKSKYRSGLRLFHIIFKRSYAVRVEMNIKRVERTSNEDLQAVESRENSSHINLSTRKLNTKMKIGIVTPARLILWKRTTMRRRILRRSHIDYCLIQISMGAR